MSKAVVVVVDNHEVFFSRTSAIQMGYGLWVSLINIVIGVALGFPSSAIPKMVADPTFDIGRTDEAWIASILALVAPIGCLIGGYTMDLVGRKYALVIGGVPFALGWVIIGLSKTAKLVIIGRVVCGVGLGMGLGTPRVFITEICLPNMRGVVSVFTTVAMSIGLILQAFLGANFEWNELSYAYGALAGVIGLSCVILPETPYFALLKGTPEDAAKALKRFRARDYNLQPEVVELIEFKNSNNIEKISWRARIRLMGTKSACLPFWIMFTYCLATQLSGASILFVWTIDFLQATRLSVAPATAHLSMEIVRLVMGLISAILMYKIGRRPQALISSFGVAVVCLVLGSYLIPTHKVSVFPFVCYLLYVIFSTLGYYTLPFMMMYELYPLQLRGFLGGITNAVFDVMIFGVNLVFPFFRDLIGHAYILIIFGVSSCLATLFLFFCLPETKGLTLQEIEEYFNDRRPTLVSQKSVVAAQRSQLLMQPGHLERTSASKRRSTL